MTRHELLVKLKCAAAECEGWEDIQFAYTPSGQAWCGTDPDGRAGIWGNGRFYIPNYCDDRYHSDRMSLLATVEAAGDKAIKRYNFTFQELALWLKFPNGTDWQRAKFSHWTAPAWTIVLCAVEALGKLEGMTIMDAARILKEDTDDESE